MGCANRVGWGRGAPSYSAGDRSRAGWKAAERWVGCAAARDSVPWVPMSRCWRWN